MKHHTALACKLLETIIETSSAMYKPLLINVLNSLYCTSFTKARKVVESVLVAMPNFAEISEELPLPIKIPYLQPTNREYSFILDFDETVVHYVDNGTESRLNVRPGGNDILKKMKLIKNIKLLLLIMSLKTSGFSLAMACSLKADLMTCRILVCLIL